jgi:hypothetical protein
MQVPVFDSPRLAMPYKSNHRPLPANFLRRLAFTLVATLFLELQMFLLTIVMILRTSRW